MPWYGWDDDFYDPDEEPTSQPTSIDTIFIEGPLRIESRRGPVANTWWGKRWVEPLGEASSGRLGRGKTYARNGSVSSLTVEAGVIIGQVEGSRWQPYEVDIDFDVIDEQTWQQVLDVMGQQPLYLAKLLAGDLPEDAEAVFKQAGASLFPKRSGMSFYCTCPDYGHPCKHGAALYYVMAAQIDRDPFLLFHVRGMPRQRVLAALDAREEAGHPLAVDGFWGAPSTVDLPEVSSALAERGEPPLQAGPDLRGLYQAVAEAAEALVPSSDTSSIASIPALPKASERLSALMVDAYDMDEAFAAMCIYFEEAMDFPFMAKWHGELFTVRGIDECDDRNHMIWLTVESRGRLQVVEATSVMPLDTNGRNATILNDYRTWTG